MWQKTTVQLESCETKRFFPQDLKKLSHPIGYFGFDPDNETGFHSNISGS